MHKNEIVKRALQIVWISILLSCTAFYLYYRNEMTALSITEWITAHTHALLFAYALICIIRGIALIPSTPFIFAGILLFPGNPGLVFVITLGCIFLSSALIYYGSGYMGFNDYFEKKYPLRITEIRNRLSHPSGFYFIALWALFPFTPTDLVVYVSGTVRLPFRRMIIPLMLGEAIICGAYIFNGMKLMQYIR